MDEIIVFDTETTTDTAQRFTFGSFQYGIRYRKQFFCLSEGLIYADDLPDRDPQGFSALEQYVKHHEADVFGDSIGAFEPDSHLALISRSQFVERWIWQVAYQHDATIVGFNLPFDLSRIAIDVSEARPPFTDGFSFHLFRYNMRPRLRIKHLSSTKSFIGWTYGNVPDGKSNRGKFVDLRTAAFSLTNRKHSLASACEAFNCPTGKYAAEEHGRITSEYIDYNRNDVSATWNLYIAVSKEFERHPISRTLDQIYSPASISKAYFEAMGVEPPLNKFTLSDDLMGDVMSAFYGARTECMIRKTSVPVTLLDFTSMYPTVNALMRLWFLLTATSIIVEDATNDVRRMIDDISLEDCFNSEIWQNFVGIVQVQPDNDIFPVRARYGEDSTFNIGINYVTSDQPLWYAIPDVVASKILTGKSPKILLAKRFVGRGTDQRLKSVRLRGETLIEPKSTDFFTWVIEERAQVKNTPLGDFLKVLANAGSYGIFIEMNRNDAIGEQPVSVWSGGNAQWNARVRHAETPGRYAFPPFAVCITSAARLMLAMLERCVTDAGGCWAFCDTDSMAIVAAESTEHIDEEIPCLDRQTVDQIIRRFDSLSPYRNDLVEHLLKVEYIGSCYVISTKRYVLYNSDQIGKYSHHGLGHVYPPEHGWEKNLWKVILNPDIPFKYNDLPLTSLWAVTTPSLYKTLSQFNAGVPYSDHIKPFNFITACYVDNYSKPQGNIKFQLITPYNPSTEDALNAEWTNKYEPGSSYQITVSNDIMTDKIRVKSFSDLLAEYRMHSEPKSVDKDGVKAGPYTIGRLYRSHIILAGLDYIGKESNKLEEAVQGELMIPEIQLRLTPRDIEWDQMRENVFAVLSRYRDSENARLAGLSKREYINIKTGSNRPHNIAREKLLAMAVHIACEDLRRSPNLIKDPRTLLMEWKMR